MKLYFKNFEIYHNISVYLFYFIFLERPRSPWEVHAEPLGLRGAQVGNLWSSMPDVYVARIAKLLLCPSVLVQASCAQCRLPHGLFPVAFPWPWLPPWWCHCIRLRLQFILLSVCLSALHAVMKRNDVTLWRHLQEFGCHTWALAHVTELMSRFTSRYACLGKSHARSHLVLVSRI